MITSHHLVVGIGRIWFRFPAISPEVASGAFSLAQPINATQLSIAVSHCGGDGRDNNFDFPLWDNNDGVKILQISFARSSHSISAKYSMSGMAICWFVVDGLAADLSLRHT